MKQILEIGNIKDFTNKCSMLFRLIPKSIIEIKDFETRCKFSDFIFTGDYAIYNIKNCIVILKKEEYYDGITIQKLIVDSDLFYNKEEIDKKYIELIEKLEIEKKTREEIQEKQERERKIFIENLLKNLYQDLLKKVEKFKELLPEDVTTHLNKDCSLTLIFPPLKKKQGNVKIRILHFNRDTMSLEYKIPNGHPNDIIFQMTNTWVSKFKEIENT